VDDRIAANARDSKRPDTAPPEPPRVYYLACGAQCDVFWWARRKPQAEGAPPADRSEPDSD
jgi:hypothetical protein